MTYKTLQGFLEPLSPTGFTPLGLALEESAEALREHDESVNRVIVVSDGQETCDGDPVAAAQELYDSGSATVDVLAFDVPEDQLPSLVEIADAGGGDLVVADDGEELHEHDPREDNREEDPDDGEDADDEGWIDLPPFERPTIPPLSDASTRSSRLTFFEEYSCGADVRADQFPEAA